jgi:hypothetical protein
LPPLPVPAPPLPVAPPAPPPPAPPDVAVLVVLVLPAAPVDVGFVVVLDVLVVEVPSPPAPDVLDVEVDVVGLDVVLLPGPGFEGVLSEPEHAPQTNVPAAAVPSNVHRAFSREAKKWRMGEPPMTVEMTRSDQSLWPLPAQKRRKSCVVPRSSRA